MRIILLIIACFSLLAHGQERVLKVTLEDIIPYDTLKCSAVFEYFDKISYLGEWQTGTNSWFFHIPDITLEKSKYIQFFANRENMPEIKYISPSFRIVSGKDTTLFHSSLLFQRKQILYLYMQSLQVKILSEIVLTTVHTVRIKLS